jgi:hypothetical protein
MVAGLALQLRAFHLVIDNNVNRCNGNFNKIEQSLRMLAEAIKGVGDTLRAMEDESEWWKGDQSG